MGACGFVAVQYDEEIDDDRVLAEHIDYFKEITSIRAELIAIYNALNWARTQEGKKRIFTDSRYCADGFGEWMHIWKKNDWKKKGGEEAAHADIWKRIYKLRNAVAQVHWVKAHSGNQWNDYIDRKVTIRKDG